MIGLTILPVLFITKIKLTDKIYIIELKNLLRLKQELRQQFLYPRQNASRFQSTYFGH